MPEKKKEVVQESLETSPNGKVFKNNATQTIITDLGRDYGYYSCSFTTHLAILRAYSNDWEGKGENQQTIAENFLFPDARAVSAYVRIHNWRHTSPPVTDEQIASGLDVDTSVDDTLRGWKYRWRKKFEQEKWRTVQKTADKWYQFETSVLETVAPIFEAKLLAPTKVNKLKLKTSREPYIAIAGAQDWHFGKLAYNARGNKDYDIEIAWDRLVDSTERLATDIALHGAPDHVLLILGSDDLHVDNLRGETTKGTPQAGQMDGSYEILLDRYLDGLIYQVETYRQIANVKIIIVGGNHNKVTALLTGRLLEEKYGHTDDIEVTRVNSDRVYSRFGNKGFVMLHGEGWSESKIKSSIHKMIMSEAAEQINTDGIDEWYVITGHIHHTREHDLGAVTWLAVPSLSSPDSWHKSAGYIGSRIGQVAYLIGQTVGKFANLFVSAK